MGKIKFIRGGQECIFDHSEIKEMTQYLGDIRRLDSGYVIRGEAEPIEVTFTDDRIELFDSWEKVPDASIKG